jgi:hypothetical protein
MGILNLNKALKHEYLKPKDAININFFQKEILAIGPSGTILRKDAFEKVGYLNRTTNLKIACSYSIVLFKKTFFITEGMKSRGFLTHIVISVIIMCMLMML